MLPEIIKDFRHEIVTSVLVSIVFGVVMYPIRRAKKVLKVAQDKWNTAQDKLDAVAAELSVQRTNCLTTIQSQGEAQIELLKKSVETLEGVRVDLAEQTGFLRAAQGVPRRKK